MTGNKLFFLMGLLFFWMMLVVPTMYQFERGIVLGVLLLASMFYVYVTHNWKVTEDIILLGFLCITASLGFIFLGVVRDAPGAIRVGTVFIVWPLVYLFFVGVVHKEEQLQMFMKTLLIGSISAAILGILFVFDYFGISNFDISGLFNNTKNIGLTKSGLMGYSLPNTTTVIYAFPFVLAWLMLPKVNKGLNHFWHFLLWGALLLLVVALVFAGRKVFWLIAALSPFIIMIIFNLCRVKISQVKVVSMIAVMLFIIVVIISYFEINIEATVNDFIAGFDFAGTNNQGAYLRNKQFDSLVAGWMEFPVFGAGHGAGAEFVRSDEAPWAYELSYVSLLFHSGLVGIIMYGGSVMWLLVQSVKIVRKKPHAAEMLIPLTSGLVCFLIAATTNPYLQKFDYLWTIFLPLAVVNAYSLKGKMIHGVKV